MNGSPSNTDTSTDTGTPARPTPGAATPDWKNEIAARVRAHRSRGSRLPDHQPTLPGLEQAVSPNAVAARVAERYARLPSWRETLEAQAATQAAAESLLAAASAQQEQTEPAQPPAQEAGASTPPEPAPQPYQPDLLRYSVSIDSLPSPRSTPPQARSVLHASAHAPDSSLADPLEDAVVEPSRPLPATLLTIPRELVAPRKARPRLAEGPLHEPALPSALVPEQQPVANSPADAPERRAQEPVSVSSAPEPPPQAAPTWHSIHLDTETPIHQPRPSSPLHDEPVLHVAPLEDRVIAALVDCVLTLCAFLLFSLVFALSSTHLPRGRVALLGACAILFAMGLLYQLLFFSLTNATPGMRYAKIALCTFGDENPARSALRGRIAALLLSALPLGLGFLWAVFDEDSLGWHDRITRTYQRSYGDP